MPIFIIKTKKLKTKKEDLTISFMLIFLIHQNDIQYQNNPLMLLSFFRVLHDR